MFTNKCKRRWFAPKNRIEISLKEFLIVRWNIQIISDKSEPFNFKLSRVFKTLLLFRKSPLPFVFLTWALAFLLLPLPTSLALRSAWQKSSPKSAYHPLSVVFTPHSTTSVFCIWMNSAQDTSPSSSYLFSACDFSKWHGQTTTTSPYECRLLACRTELKAGPSPGTCI